MMQRLPKTTDILIVGAGPAGLALAAELRRLDASVVVIDKQAEGANTSRAAVVHAHTLEVLEKIGATSELLNLGVRVPTFRVRDRDTLLISIKFENLPTAYPFTLMCPQDQTEKILLSRLAAFGGTVIRPAVLKNAIAEGDAVRAQIDYDGNSAELVAKYVVGCDGMHSVVRDLAGIGFDGGSYEEDFILADVRMSWPLSREEVNLFFSPSGLVVVAPLPDERYRIVATAVNAPPTPSPAFLQALLDTRGPQHSAAQVGEVLWGSRFHVHHRVAETPKRARFLLCGDAAHVHSPAGGQGMNTGIQDAVSLAAPLVSALATGQERELDAWAVARHEVALRVVALTDRMTRAATLTSKAKRAFRNAALSFVGHIPQAQEAIARSLAGLGDR